MNEKKILNTGEIYLDRFHPAFGAELKRFRPAVIVSSRVTAHDSRFALIAPLTTQTKTTNTSIELLITNNPVLEKPSLVLTWYLQTIDIHRLEQKIGTLSPNDIKKMKKAVYSLID